MSVGVQVLVVIGSFVAAGLLSMPVVAWFQRRRDRRAIAEIEARVGKDTLEAINHAIDTANRAGLSVDDIRRNIAGLRRTLEECGVSAEDVRPLRGRRW